MDVEASKNRTLRDSNDSYKNFKLTKIFAARILEIVNKVVVFSEGLLCSMSVVAQFKYHHILCGKSYIHVDSVDGYSKPNTNQWLQQKSKEMCLKVSLLRLHRRKSEAADYLLILVYQTRPMYCT